MNPQTFTTSHLACVGVMIFACGFLFGVAVTFRFCTKELRALRELIGRPS